MQGKLSEQQIQAILRAAELLRSSPIDPEIAWEEELQLRMDQGDMKDLGNLMAISKLLGQTDRSTDE
jgi:hypothetical protein